MELCPGGNLFDMLEKREGKGIFYYEDGYEFMGTWVDNLPYNGMLFSASGLMAGKYVDGELKKN